MVAEKTPHPLQVVYQGPHAERRKEGRLVVVAPFYVAHILPMRDALSGVTVLEVSLKEPPRCTLTLAWGRNDERPSVVYLIGRQRHARQPDLFLQAAFLRHAAHQCAWQAYTRRGYSDESLYHDAHAMIAAELRNVQERRTAGLSPAECCEIADLDAAIDRTASGARRAVEVRS